MRHSRTALGAVLLLLTLSASALSFGRERTVAPPRYAPTFGHQTHALATDGTTFLSVWTEGTVGREGIYSAVRDEQGNTRPTPSRVLVHGRSIGGVLAVWAGDAYQLVWWDGVRQSSMAARVSRDGELLTQPIAIIEGAPVHAIAWNGRHTLLVFVEGNTIAGALLGRDRLERGRFVISSATDAVTASVVAAGSSFAVTWGELAWFATPLRSAVRSIRVSGDGEAGPVVTVVADQAVGISSINSASDGDRVGIVFTSGTPLSQSIRRFTLDLQTLAVTQHPRIFTGSMDRQVIATPDGFVVAYLAFDTGTLVLNVAPFAASAPRGIIVGPNVGSDLRLVAGNGSVGAVWRDARLSPLEGAALVLVGTTLDSFAERRTEDIVPIAVAAVRQVSPLIAPAGNDALVVWVEQEHSSGGNIVATRVDASGNALDAPLLLASNIPEARPSAVFAGNVWIVAWYHEGETYSRRIARNGTLLDASPVSVGRGYLSPLAANGDVAVMLLATTTETSLVRFSADGEKVGAPLTVDIPFGAIASNGREFLVVWEEGSNWWQFPTQDLRDIRGIRLDVSGAPIDAAPLEIAVGSADTGSPHVASDGKDFLVVYEQIDWDERRSFVRTKRVLRNGNLDGVTARQDGALVAADAFPAGVADWESGYAVMFVPFSSASLSAVSVVPVDTRGVPSDKPLRLAESDADHAGSAIASSRAQTWAAYAKTTADADNVVRVFVRTLQANEGEPRRRTVRR